MKIIWKIHRFFKNSIPKTVIKGFRHFFESNFDSLWEKKYYSQFAEDAILDNIIATRLWNSNLQRSNKESSSGFYIDVGAYSPKQFSNTYLFYKKGWNGINIDAAPDSMKIFQKMRKRDINIEAAISNSNQELIFYSWGPHNVANTFSKEHAELFTKNFGKQPQELILKPQPLEKILDKYLPKDQQIDFMSIDAENHNLEVLKSNNWKKYRPTFVIVEADAQTPTIEEIKTSLIFTYMQEQSYHLIGWIDINLFFEKNV